MIRTTMEFFVRFADGDERWVTWNKDLFDTVQYEQFCRAHPPLMPLIYTMSQAKARIREIKASPITDVTPGTKIYLDLRSRGGATWYNDLRLPHSEKLIYVLTCVYTQWVGRQRKKIRLRCDLTDEDIDVDNFFVLTYGRTTVFNPDTMVHIDRALCAAHPKIMPH